MAKRSHLRPHVYRINALVHRLDLRGKKYAEVLAVVSGGKESIQFTSRAEADRKADEIQSLLEKHGKQRLSSVGKMLNEDFDALARKLAPFNRTLTDAVDFYVAHLVEQKEREASETLGALVDLWLADKKARFEKGTLRPRTLQTLKFFGDKFKRQWGGRRVGTITRHEIKEWLGSLNVRIGESAVSAISSTYEQHHLSYLSQFFIWCRKNYQYPRDNPCESIEVKHVTEEPQLFTVKECEKLLRLCLTDEFVELLPFHAICLFAGVRPKECERLKWKDIDFDDSSLVVLKGQAKTRNARRIEMLPTLKTWLQWFQKRHPSDELIPKDFERKEKTFRQELGKWKHNGMRHSFASYYLSGIKKDFGALEANMGNSRLILQKHYVQFPSKNDAAKFWELTPKSISAKPKKMDDE
jgi:integrase